MTSTCIATLTEDNLNEIAERASAIWAWMNTPEFELDQLAAECAIYSPNWESPRATMTHLGVDFRYDGKSYIQECLRYMVLNIAAGGMLEVPSLMDAGMHAAMAQSMWMRRLATANYWVVHRTSEEVTMTPYARGCMTDKLYELTFGETPPEQWWIDQGIIDERAQRLFDHLDGVGIHMSFDSVGVQVEPNALGFN